MTTIDERRWPFYDKDEEREYSMLDYMVALFVVFLVVLGCSWLSMLWCYNWWRSKSYSVPL